MSSVKGPRFDHIGITVADLQAATAFFLKLGLEIEGGPMMMEGDFIDTVIGIPNARAEIIMMRVPNGTENTTKLELSQFHRPDALPGSPLAPSNELGLRNICFEVADLRALVDELKADGFDLVGGIGQHENIWLMCYVRGPEGLLISLAQRID